LSAASPVNDPVNDPVTLSPLTCVTVSPKLIVVDPNVIDELAKVLFGMFAKSKVIVSFEILPDIVNPVPAEPVTMLNEDVSELANNSTPLIDAVAYASVVATVVTYPASLLNCDMLLPDTATFFHSAMSYSLYV
jgi:hypothetical protein